ncbi:hypothetical protein ACF3NT_14155 [Naumannella halotolerans]|uniref:hypothetical protein n=1 Tax=Naumannella halotolerans TaxID=993414 RepID=UPI00370D35E1
METLTETQIRRRVESAYRLFVIRDRYLLQCDANERSLTHKLAEYLVPQFPHWDVDCEFNRDGKVPKSVPSWRGNISPSDTQAKTVFPDIIVHKRGSDQNLLVIEAKKSSTAATSEDAAKLAAYRSSLAYRFVCLVVFPVGPAGRPRAADDVSFPDRSTPTG